MRNIPPLNGLEWASDANATLDAISLAPVAPYPPVTLAQVMAALSSMEWFDWASWMAERGGAIHPAHKGFVGVVGVSAPRRLWLRYCWRKGTNPADGLYAIEERDELPAEIAAAVLTAATAKPAGDTASAVVRLFGKLATTITDAPAARAPRLSRAALDGAVVQYVRSTLAGGEPPVPAGSTNRARFLLALGAHLWQPETLRLAGQAPDLDRLAYLNEVAILYAILHADAATYRAGSTPVRLPALMGGSVWAEACNWAAHNITADAARFLAGFRATDDSWPLTTRLPKLDPRHADAIAAGLLREAAARQVYVATGQFVLALPAHLPWAQTPITALAIYAQADGLWCAGLTAQRERTASWWWSPDMHVADTLQHTLPASPLVHVTLAAFWHDLVVAGDEVVVTVGQPVGQNDKLSSRNDKLSSYRPQAVTLPRRSVHITGRREWSTPADREAIQRRSHGVRGHLRELPDTWARSSYAEQEASEWGFVLPDGFTFVRPHIRGGHDGDPAPVVARARGLQTISALLQRD